MQLAANQRSPNPMMPEEINPGSILGGGGSLAFRERGKVIMVVRALRHTLCLAPADGQTHPFDVVTDDIHTPRPSLVVQ